MGGEAEAVAEAFDVGIDGDTLVDAEAVGEDDVGGFAGYTGEGEQFGHGIGDFSAKVGDDFLTGPLDVFGFVAVEAGGADQGFDFEAIALRKGDRIREPRKQGWRNLIHPLIGALGGKNRRHH